MQQIILAFDGFIPAFTVLFPSAVLVAALSGTVRSNRLRSVSPLRDPLIDALLVFAVLLTGFLVFYPQPEIPDQVKMEVGDDLYTALTAGSGNSEPWVQLAGNLVLLVPVAVLVPLRVRWFDGLGKIVIGGLLTALVIETVQFFAIPGRVASTDDVVLNTLGATLGGLLVCTPWWSGHEPLPGPSHRPAEPETTQTVWRIIEKIEHERTPARRRAAPSSPGGSPTVRVGAPRSMAAPRSVASRPLAVSSATAVSAAAARPAVPDSVAASGVAAPASSPAAAPGRAAATTSKAGPASKVAPSPELAPSAAARPAAAPNASAPRNPGTGDLPVRTPGARTPIPPHRAVREPARRP